MNDATALADRAARPTDPVLDALAVSLIDRYQDHVPFVESPYAEMARTLASTESAVLRALADLRGRGVLARVGPVFAPHALGASTLAALEAPPERLDEIAAIVSGYEEVNHNYAREHALNLWFVVTAPDTARLSAVLDEIRARTGLAVLDLPLLEPYHIDLGFSPWNDTGAKRRVRPGPCGPHRPEPTTLERTIAAAVEDGIAIVPRPFRPVAERTGCDLATVLASLERLHGTGAIKRFGLVVRHHELGFRSNAMVVMDVPDDRVDAVGRRLARERAVTLCYRRPRRPPRWRYNLFCMIHGRARGAALDEARRLRSIARLADEDWDVLFSTRRFKQRGARYAARRGDGSCAA